MTSRTPRTFDDNQARTTLAARPVSVRTPGRGDDLQVRVTAPATGERLPVVVFSHGYGWSMDAYAPLVDYWASAGLVVVQPTHLDSRTLALAADDPRTPDIWRTRTTDLRSCIDQLTQLASAVPGLSERIAADRIGVAGHSWGAQSASTLLGARVLGADDEPGEDMTDARVRAGVLLSLTGTGESLTPFAAENFPFMRPYFATLTTSTLVVAGEKDDSPLSSRGPDWFADGYRLSPGASHLLTVHGGEHSLGGIAGYVVAETTDENPGRVALVQKLTTAFLHATLNATSPSFDGLFPPLLLSDGSETVGTVSAK